jgi:Zn-dependent protease
MQPREPYVLMEQQVPSYYRVYGRPRKGWLTPEEKRNLLIAMGALTLCLTMVMYFGLGGLFAALSDEPSDVLFTVIVAAITTATGFAMHELAHKFVAQRYGCWAEFRYSVRGLFFALVTATFGFLFAAPGAVYIAGRVDARQNGLISIAGPVTNTLVTLAFIPIVLLFGGSATDVGQKLHIVAYFNAFLAVFNMIPVMPLDGAKVLRWNKGIYVGAMALMVALLVLLWSGFL